jgi:hypothetical protein
MQAHGHAVGVVRFKNHWNTFITEQDIANIGNCIRKIVINCNRDNNRFICAIASNSLNAAVRVRVPIGWWIVDYDHNDTSNQQAWKNFRS